MSILSAILLVALLVTLYRCRVPWFEPVSKLIDRYTPSESFFPAFRGRELGNIGINHYISRDNTNIPNVSFESSPGNFGYP